MTAKHNDSPLKIAVLGCGNWGKNLIRVLNDLGALHSICDTNPSKAKEFSEKYGIPSLTFHEIADNPAITGVMISTPSVTHTALAHLMLENDKHVFIEKPFAINVKEAIALHELALKQNKVLMVGHLLQYHPVFQTLKKMTHEKVFGDLHYICSHRSNFGNFQTENTVLWDYAPHDLSMILSLVGGMPHQVSASGSSYLAHTQADLSCINLSFPHKVHAHIFSAWMHPFKEQKLTLVGSKGMAIFDDCQAWENKLKLFHNTGSQLLPMEFPPIEPGEPLRRECSHFLDCIIQGTRPQTNSLEGINITAIIESAIQSIAENQPISMRKVSHLAINDSHKSNELLASELALEETYLS